LCSIEDPIEIRLPGINQVAYHPRAGLDFAVIIKALLRQDPDVIMIGEIRDSMTAQLAIQAAQTGHLVLSTLHTRNAQGALARLQSLGIDEEPLESCLHFVSSQRLVRRRCQDCNGPNLTNSGTSSEVCDSCKGHGYFGRIGIHEILSRENLFNRELPILSMSEVGLRRIAEGVIDRAALDAEIYA
jgi:type IV pilus assembly protein PilB